AAAAAAKDATAIDRQNIARDSAADAQLTARIATLEKSVSDLAAARNAETIDRAARRALAVLTLREAVLSGETYDAELKAASALGVDKAALAKLEPLAASGVPGAPALARDLTALVPALRAVGQSETPQPSGTGFLDRLEANAAKLVRVRPVGSTAGSDPQAVIARVEQHAARGDIAAALTELKTLPPRSRAPADGWIGRVEARNAALQASRTLLADTSRAFGSR
ncbi:MAG: COG4223 family protein, partial [Pseudolabrys sp.]